MSQIKRENQAGFLSYKESVVEFQGGDGEYERVRISLKSREGMDNKRRRKDHFEVGE